MSATTEESTLMSTSTKRSHSEIPGQAVRPVLPALKALFLVGSILVLLGGTQLFIFSERTEDFFAWTIKAPVTAAVDGAFFYTGFLLLFPASRAKSWAAVRPVAFAVLIVATTKLLATLLDLDLFHFDDAFQPAFAAWAWLAVYIVIPVGLLVLISMQLRMDGGDPPPGTALPAVLKVAFLAISAVMLAIGAILLVSSSTAIDIWPWPLTPLTSHALSAWFLGVGALAAFTVRENDVERSLWTFIGSAALGVMLAVAIARYGGDVDWDEPVAWVLAGLIALVTVTGLYGVARARSAG